MRKSWVEDILISFSVATLQRFESTFLDFAGLGARILGMTWPVGSSSVSGSRRARPPGLILGLSITWPAREGSISRL